MENGPIRLRVAKACCSLYIDSARVLAIFYRQRSHLSSPALPSVIHTRISANGRCVYCWLVLHVSVISFLGCYMREEKKLRNLHRRVPLVIPRTDFVRLSHGRCCCWPLPIAYFMPFLLIVVIWAAPYTSQKNPSTFNDATISQRNVLHTWVSPACPSYKHTQRNFVCCCLDDISSLFVCG